MALTITPVPGTRNSDGRYFSQIVDIALDNSYPTGGYAISPRDVGLGLTIFGMQIIGGNSAANGRKAMWDTGNNKLMLAQDAGAAGAMAQVPNATDVSTLTFRVKVTGF